MYVSIAGYILTAPQTSKPASPQTTPGTKPSSAGDKGRKTSSIFNLERNPSSNSPHPTSGTNTVSGRDEARATTIEAPPSGTVDIGSGGTPIASDDEDYGATGDVAGSGYNETGSAQ